MTKPSTDLATFIRAMPKAELHVHLEGAMQPATLLHLAQRHGKMDTLPATDEAGLRKWYAFTGFNHFVEVYLTIQNLITTAEDFELCAYECGKDMAAQGIRYREVTLTPHTHIDFQDKGLSIDDVLGGLEAGREKALAEFGVEMRWVFDIYRNLAFPNNDGKQYDPEPAERTVNYAINGIDQCVVGLGLGGSEIGAPPEPFTHAFAVAKEAGLLSVPHAGETEGPCSIWGSINDLQADRIGHGVRAIEDLHLLQYLKDRQIPLELCLTSNERLHIYKSLAGHPFPHLDNMGLMVTLNSDDPPLFNTELCQEYEVAAGQFGYDRENLIRIARNGFLASGAEPELKEKLLMEFDDWAGGQ